LGGENFYAYALNDPTNFVDLNGKFAAAAPLAIPFGPILGIAVGAGAIACALSADCRSFIKDFFAPKPKPIPAPATCDGAPPAPEPPPPNCAEQCADYMGPLKRYVNQDGDVFSNDSYGNAQYASYECLRECEEGG